MTFGGGQFVADAPFVGAADAFDALEPPDWLAKFEASQGAIDAFFLRALFFAADAFDDGADS
jgi:hypothetical protein